jgi:hypothetical protein
VAVSQLPPSGLVQTPATQAEIDPHPWHASPACPQLNAPCWPACTQTLPEQQPSPHEMASQPVWQKPASTTHSAPNDPQLWQMLPPRPHWKSLVPATHWPPLQHPLGQLEGEQTAQCPASRSQAPPKDWQLAHCWPPAPHWKSKLPCTH